MCDGVYTFRDKYRMAAIYSELLEDYFITNINSDLFGDDGTKDDVEDPTSSIFTSKLGLCRGTIAILEEVKLKKTFVGAPAMNRRVWDHGTAATFYRDSYR